MASTTTRRKGGAPKSMEGVMQFEQPTAMTRMPVNEFTGKPLKIADTTMTVGKGTATVTTSTTTSPMSKMKSVIQTTATVKRHKYGTGPFDEHWLNLDCCGIFCALITYGLHIYGMYAVCLILLPPWMSVTDEEGVRSLTFMGHLHRVCFSGVAILAMAAHYKAMTTDPGAVPPDAIPLEEPLPTTTTTTTNDKDNEMQSAAAAAPPPPPQRKGKRLCRRCKTFKPKRAHHCSICQRCIIKMDHHCPWVNNCVGIGNHKYFLLFIFYTFLSCIYSFTLVMTRFYSCMSRSGHTRSQHLTCLDHPTQLLSILGLVVEAILFGLFTACMICDQSSVVTSKMTHIDRMKGGNDDDDPLSSSLAGVVEVFGIHLKRGNDSKFRSDWLSPFAKVCFPSSLQDEIMGFCRPCGGGGGGGRDNHNTNIMESSPRHDGTRTPLVRSVAEIV